jgi:predicted dehydrogenase
MMRILQIGGGSMGTRRMRDLHGRRFDSDVIEVALLDGRADRREGATSRFGLTTFDTMAAALAFEPDAFVISTPPDRHTELVQLALDTGRHVFCEADIWPFDPDVVETATRRTGLVAAPSATLLFHPVIREVARIVADELGPLHAFGYVLSVDAPSWHPGEGPEYYARHRATAPAREMTAFELIALQSLFGAAGTVSGIVQRRGGLDIAGEDSYSLQYRTTTGVAGHLTVLMAAPQVARRGWAAGDNGIVFFDLLSGVVERQLPGIDRSDSFKVCDWAATLESVYLDEITTFIDTIRGEKVWPFTYRDSAAVCATLAAAELSSLTGQTESVRPDLVPAPLPDCYPLPDSKLLA